VCQPVPVLMLSGVLLPVLGMAGILLMGRLEARLGTRPRFELDPPPTAPSPASDPVAHLDSTGPLDRLPGTTPA
jgi:hypothetical protein